eukprot:TRINITY_DN15493_c0_g3_i1.p1 TRINITY_DN15493_c0_g3~~TRINITY_DN15493_c0_g3_i1.p1  ORF type:complete len:500 (+),score=88.73 TRINITY_DN15493_c0_g3_i1:150-1649(+)
MSADDFDLLGLSANDIAEAPPKVETRPQTELDLLGLSANQAPQKPASRAPQEPVIAYPSAFAQDVNPEPSSTVSATPEEPGQKRFTVRCEGRWRVRSAPSLSSKVVGTISSGTIVVGDICPTEGVNPLTSRPFAPEEFDIHPPEIAEAMRSITALWVQVTRFEAQEPLGVSEIRHDSASGGRLYCLRRNAMGYGLYQSDVEPMQGPLVNLPDNLAVELRLDAQKASSDKSEDVSLTWKLLGAAESFGRLFGSSNDSDEGGINEDIKPIARRRPEDMFEVKQRDQLKKAANSLRTPLEKLLAKAKEENADHIDLLNGLPIEVRRRFARVRASLNASSSSSSNLVVPVIPLEEPKAEVTDEPQTFAEGSSAELQNFVQLCERLERTGGWCGLGLELRTEMLNFSSKHSRDIYDYVRVCCKNGLANFDSPAARSGGVLSPKSTTASPAGADSLLGDLLGSPESSKPAGGYANASSSAKPLGALPFLAPPPTSVCSVGTSKLV